MKEYQGDKRYRIDEDIPRGYQEKPILKEAQKKVLEKLLEVDRQSLSPDEQELMKKLLDALDTDTRRIKDLRKQLEGHGPLSEILESLKKDTDSFRKPAEGEVRPSSPTAVPKSSMPTPSPVQQPPARRPSSPSIQKTTTPTPPPIRSRPVSPPSGSTSQLPPSTQSKSGSSRPLSWNAVLNSKKESPSTPEKVQPQPVVQPAPQRAPVAPEVKEKPVIKVGETLVVESTPESRAEKSQTRFSPVEVVQRYISAWNHKAFGAEYDCFSSSYMPMSKEDYVNRRMATYLAYNKEGRFVQEMGAILKTHLEGDHAEVMCNRSVREFHKMNHYLDLYVLRLEEGQWRITGVTTTRAEPGGGISKPRDSSGKIPPSNG